MRDLALKTLTGDYYGACLANGSNSSRLVVPCDCELVGVVFNFSVLPLTAHTFDIQVNLADTGIDIPCVASTPNGFYPPDQRTFLSAGDTFRLTGNGESSAQTSAGTLSWVFRPLSPRPVGEIWLGGQGFSDIATPAVATAVKCVPIACEVTEVAFGMFAATDDEIDVSILIDAADSGIDIVIPTSTRNAVLNPVGRIFCKTGASINLRTDGAGTTGAYTAVTYVLQPQSNEIPVGWVYSAFTGGRAFHTPTTEFTDIVAPCHGRIRNLVTHWRQPINTTPNTGATFDLEVNGAKPTGTPIYRNTEDTIDEVGVSIDIENMHDVFVRQGDLIKIEINGEQVADSNNGTAGIWIEPMGQAAGDGP